METLLFAGQHAQAELHCERKLREAHALGQYREMICTAADALRRVADSRDAFVYYRVGVELGLQWDPLKAPCDLKYAEECKHQGRNLGTCRTSIM